MKILLVFTCKTGCSHPGLPTIVNNYGALLVKMGYSQAEVEKKTSEMVLGLFR